MSAPARQRWMWLSHPLGEETPAYGGGAGVRIAAQKEIARGDSCNTVALTLSNHSGSHVDAPRHFLAAGATVVDYAPEAWMFDRPLLIDLPAAADELIGVPAMRAALAEATAVQLEGVDLLLARTGFEQFRGVDAYWRNGPGFAPELAPFFAERFPALRAFGMDTLSLSAPAHRQAGRAAHRALLGGDIRLFEDLRLSAIPTGRGLRQVIALPLRFTAADGAPCTVVGRLNG